MIARKLVRRVVGRDLCLRCSSHNGSSRSLYCTEESASNPFKILDPDKITFVVECSFQHGGREGKKTLHSLAKQLKLATTVLQSHPIASNLHLTGVDDTFAPYLQLKGVWDISTHTSSVPDLLQPGDKDKVILLSPDAPEALETVEKGYAYVIGGIVDRTPAKYKSLFFAREHDLQVKKLPMEGNVTFTGTGSLNAKWHLLNIEHVVDALLQFHVSGNWRQTFDNVLPARKKRRS